MNEPVMNDILDFWFEGVTDQTVADKRSRPFNKWFKTDTAFDNEIKERFERHFRKALAGDCRAWESTARGRLALIILFDQFSRNMYRGTAGAYATDAMALELCRRSLDDGMDRGLDLVARIFLYMPLMHAEDAVLQERSVVAFEDLVEKSRTRCPHNTAYFEYHLAFARQHADIIRTFGRFPYRNIILKRALTPAEEAFLNNKRGRS